MTKPKSTTPQAARKPEPKISSYMRSKLNALIKSCEIDVKAPALLELEKAVLKLEQKLLEPVPKIAVDKSVITDVPTDGKEWDFLTMGDRRAYEPPEMADADDDKLEDAEGSDGDYEQESDLLRVVHVGSSLDQDAFKAALKNFVEIGKFKSEEYGPVFIRASLYPDSKCLCVTVETDEDGVLEYLSMNPIDLPASIDPKVFPKGTCFATQNNLEFTFLRNSSTESSELRLEAHASGFLTMASGSLYYFQNGLVATNYRVKNPSVLYPLYK